MSIENSRNMACSIISGDWS